MDLSRRLYRSEQNRMIAGVCGGIGEYFGIDPTLVRVAFVLATVFGGGPLLYVALWIIMPSATRADALPRDTPRDGIVEMREGVQRGAERAHGAYERWRADRDEGAGTA